MRLAIAHTATVQLISATLDMSRMLPKGSTVGGPRVRLGPRRGRRLWHKLHIAGACLIPAQQPVRNFQSSGDGETGFTRGQIIRGATQPLRRISQAVGPRSGKVIQFTQRDPYLSCKINKRRGESGKGQYK